MRQGIQASTDAIQSARQAVVAMAGFAEASRVQVSAAVDSVAGALVDIKTHTEQTVVRLDALQNGLTAKYAALEKVNVSMQMQRHAVIDCVEQIAQARMAIESGRVFTPASTPVATAVTA
jgi:hypothetical protein